jgi:hypothetical protein
VRALIIAGLFVIGCSSSAEDPASGGVDSSVSDGGADSAVADSETVDSTTTDSAIDSSTTTDSATDTAKPGDAASDSNAPSDASADTSGVACSGKGTTCSSAEICTFPVGSCGVGSGTCQTKPSKGTCASLPEDKVCGCDGTSYTNPCFAALSGTSVKSSGTCAPSTCGNGTCDVGENCSTCPGDCGACTGCGDGVCIKGVEDCVTCAMDCCATICTESTSCAGDMFCKFVTGGCKVKGSTGNCVAPPASCPSPGAGDLVCGCDGTAYVSECEAARSGTSVAHTGACP